MYLHQQQTRNNGIRRIDEVWRHFGESVNMTFFLSFFFKVGYSFRVIAGSIIDMDPRRGMVGWSWSPKCFTLLLNPTSEGGKKSTSYVLCM